MYGRWPIGWTTANRLMRAFTAGPTPADVAGVEGVHPVAVTVHRLLNLGGEVARLLHQVIQGGVQMVDDLVRVPGTVERPQSPDSVRHLECRVDDVLRELLPA